MGGYQDSLDGNEPKDVVPVEPTQRSRQREDRATSWMSTFSLGPILGILLALVLAGSGFLDVVANAATDAIRAQSSNAVVDLRSQVSPATDGETADVTPADVAALANPAVVTVRTALDVSQAPQGSALAPGQGPRQERYSSGSGFLIDDQGHIVTNAHVVAGGTSYEVTLLDGTAVDAQLVGYDQFADVAVLQIDPGDVDDLPTPLTLGDSDTLRPGDQVVAIGSPYGDLTNTVSVGTVGAVGRTLTTSSGNYALAGLIQHDAALYPGNSGGPLLNMNGEVVGVNVAKLEVTGGTGGGSFGFALASNDIKPIIAQILSGQEVERPYLGIVAQTTREGYQVVVDVDPTGPAADALQPGDIITKINNEEITPDNPFLNVLFGYQPGDTIELTVLRDGETTQIQITLGSRPASSEA